MKRPIALIAAAAGLALAGPVLAADAPVDGTWQKHEHMFTYMGFTSTYSCEGLSEKLKLMLKLAGARPGFKVQSTCAAPSGVPDKIATARLTFYTLAPAGAPPPPPPKGKAAEAGEPGQGAWRTVSWQVNRPREFQSGDCELVDQFARELLPMFTTRDVVSRMSCVPNQVNIAGINLTFGVLGALPEAARPVAAN